MSQPITLSVCFLALTGGLTTCEDDQAATRREAAQQVKQAADQYQRIARVQALPGGEAFADRRAKLDTLLREARSVEDATDGPAGAKSLLVASIQRELAAMDMTEASRAEQSLSRERRMAHTLLDASKRLAAQAEARRSIQLPEARTRLANQREVAQTLRLEATETLETLAVPIEELTAQNAADAAEAARLIEEANRLRQESDELGPALGFSRFEQAVNLEREADRHEYAIARREIDLDLELKPEHRLAQRMVTETQAMLESAGRSERSLDEFLQAMAADADVTRQQVVRLAGTIGERIQQLESVVDGDGENVTGLYDQAADRLEDAVRQAGGAVRKLDGNDAAAARLAEARASAQLGRVRWSKAAGLLQHRTLVARLAEADSPIGDTSRYQTRLRALDEALRTTLEQTTEAYTAAQTSLGQVSFRGRDAGDANLALGAFKSSVDEALGSLTDEEGTLPLEIGGPADSTASTTAAGGPAAAASGRGLLSPQALLQRIQRFDESEDNVEAFLTLCYTSSPNAQAVLDASATMASAMEQIQDAFEAQYGTRMTGMSGQTGGGGGSVVPALGDASIENETEDTATCRFTNPMGQSDDITFRKVDGRWYVDADELVAASPITPAQISQMTSAFQQVAGDVAPRIRSGEFANAQAAEMAIGQAIMQAMMGAMGQ